MNKKERKLKKITLTLKDTLETNLWKSNEMKYILNVFLNEYPSIAKEINYKIPENFTKL